MSFFYFYLPTYYLPICLSFFLSTYLIVFTINCRSYCFTLAGVSSIVYLLINPFTCLFIYLSIHFLFYLPVYQSFFLYIYFLDYLLNCLSNYTITHTMIISLMVVFKKIDERCLASKPSFDLKPTIRRGPCIYQGTQEARGLIKPTSL